MSNKKQTLQHVRKKNITYKKKLAKDLLTFTQGQANKANYYINDE